MSISTAVDAIWIRVGDVPTTGLTDARLQLHHAAQVAVSAAISYIPSRSDDSHTALTWSASARALLTEPISASKPFRIGLRVQDLTLLAINEATAGTRSFALASRTIADGHAWLTEIAADAGLDTARLTSRKHYTIPDHPVAGGRAFSSGTGVELTELSRYWSNAAAIIQGLVRTTPGASAVRTWPHHFDIATLIALPVGKKTIGVGHSPGDDSYAEPYWYVGPYPYPETGALPPLPVGHWHTKGWVGAALPASAYVQASDQRAHVATFVDAAFASCRSLLGAAS